MKYRGLKYILAHDLGTSGNKAALFTLDGDLLNSNVKGYSTSYFNNNWAEQNPQDWWNAVCLSTQELVREIDLSEIAAIVFSGQMMGCLCVDAKGNPLRNHMLYCDQRATDEEKDILQKIGPKDFYHITGHRVSSSYSAAKLMWVKKNQPGIYKNTFKMLHAKDYINFKMTGNMVSDVTDASGTNLLDLKTLSWSPRLVDISGIDPAKLPELVPSTAVIGELRKDAAEAMGLAPGIPVVAGAGDGLCAGVGVGSIQEGVTYNYLGSSSWIASTSKAPVYDEEMRTFVWAHAVPGFVHPCGTMQTAGSSYSWLKNEIAKIENVEAKQRGVSPYEIINSLIEKSPPGAKGLIYLPYLLGERSPRWDPDAKGAFIGITMEHRREDIMRAVLEGVTLNLGIILEIFKKQIPIEEVIVIGGGAKGRVWRQIMADIYDTDILMPTHLEEATSMGAAVIGGVGVGEFKDFSVIDRFLSIKQRTNPVPEHRDVYNNMKPIFNDCYSSLKDIFSKLSAIRKVV